jgi:hypothetical protein
VCAIVVAPLFLLVDAARAEQNSPSPTRALVSVPFVGRDSDGQVGSYHAPKHVKASASLDPVLAHRLAYIKRPKGPACLPRVVGSVLGPTVREAIR